MARFSGFLLFFSVLLTLSTTSVSQTVVESSPSLSQTVANSNITIGSSISATGASFWLSPSGIFSFGFYPINIYYQEYIIGIWINNNPIRQTLVWSINGDDSPLSNATSLLLNNDGKFVIQFSNGAEEKPLFHQADTLLLSSPISYASILDNGNLVFYNSNSTIIWNSFNYPTDTILPGQTLRPKQSLTSTDMDSYGSIDMYRLIMRRNGNLELYTMKQFYSCPCRAWDDNYDHTYIFWETETKKKNGVPVELKLDSTGHLYLGDWNGVIKKSLNNGSIDKDGEEQQQQEDNKVILYRATLERDGVFRLYKETIDGNASAEEEIHTAVWDTRMKIDDHSDPLDNVTINICLYVFIAAVVIGPSICIGLCLLEQFHERSGCNRDGCITKMIFRSAKKIENV